MKVGQLARKNVASLRPRGKQQRKASPAASDKSTASDIDIKAETKPKRKKRKTTETASLVRANIESLREKGIKVSTILKELFPVVEIPLKHETPFQLLVAVLLSAQVHT